MVRVLSEWSEEQSELIPYELYNLSRAPHFRAGSKIEGKPNQVSFLASVLLAAYPVWDLVSAGVDPSCHRLRSGVKPEYQMANMATQMSTLISTPPTN